MLLRGAFIYNPVLVQVIGICPIVAATVSLSAAAVMAAITVLLLLICEILASVALKKVPAWIRVAIYMAVGLLIACPVMYIADIRDYVMGVSIGIYLPLLAVSSLTALRCEKFAVKNNALASFFDAAAAGLGYSAVFLIVGAVREFLGSGTIGGKVIVQNAPMPGMLMTFGGFIVIGMLAALHKYIAIKIFPRFERDMTFKIKTSKAEALKVPSIHRRDAGNPVAMKDITELLPESENRGSDEMRDETPEDGNEIGIDEADSRPLGGVVYVPDIPEAEEPEEAEETIEEISEETAEEITPDIFDGLPEEINKDDAQNIIKDFEMLNNEIEPDEDEPAEGDIAADEGKPEAESKEGADEDFDRNMSELFEQFKKKHNLDD